MGYVEEFFGVYEYIHRMVRAIYFCLDFFVDFITYFVRKVFFILLSFFFSSLLFLLFIFYYSLP